MEAFAYDITEAFAYDITGAFASGTEALSHSHIRTAAYIKDFGMARRIEKASRRIRKNARIASAQPRYSPKALAQTPLVKANAYRTGESKNGNAKRQKPNEAKRWKNAVVHRICK